MLPVATPPAQFAALADGTRSYAIVYESEDASNASITRETLTVQTSRGRTYVVIANANGAAAGFPAVLALDGEIETQAADPAVVCYNMTMSLVAQHQQNPAGPLSLLLSFGGRAVAVPMAVKRQAAPASHIIVSGQLGAAAVDARVDVDDASIANALFQELTFAGAPARIVARTMCSLGPATAAPAKQNAIRT